MGYHFSRLQNGLKVVTVPMHDRASVAVAVWIRTGSRFEPGRLNGISHFLEHMLFKGTKKRTTRQIKEAVEGVGGVLNAFTSEECTCYFAKLLEEHFSVAFDVLSDMVANASLSGEEFKKEKTVILEEIKMYRDLPSQHVHDMMGELLWPDQPLGRPIAGTIESVEKLSRADLAAYKRRYYHPANIVVSVSGPVTHDEVMERAREVFEPLTGNPVSKFEKARNRQAKPRFRFQEKQTEQTHFVAGFHGLSRSDADRYKLGLLNVILGANMSSRLFEEVREKKGLAYEIRSGTSFYEDAGSITISAGVETSKAPQAMRIILRELDKLKRKPVSVAELTRAKDYFMSQLTLGLEDTLDHLLWVCDRAMFREELPDKEKIREQIEEVLPKDIQTMARRLFLTEGLNLTLVGPVNSGMQKKIQNEIEIA